MSNPRILFTVLSLTLALGSLRAMDHSVAVSVYQGRSAQGDFTANLTTVRRVLADAIQRGSQFLVFPERFLSSRADPQTIRHDARGFDDSELADFVSETAAHDVVVVLGMVRRSGEDLYDSVLVIQGGRLLGHQDKIQLTRADRDTLGFKPGTAVPVFWAHGVHFAALVAEDALLPHAPTLARLQGAELLLASHNDAAAAPLVEEYARRVRQCQSALAGHLGMAVARSSGLQPSLPGDQPCANSYILDPQGGFLAQAGTNEMLLTARLDPAMFGSPFFDTDWNQGPTWLRDQVARALDNSRPPTDEADQRYWLENMVLYHRFLPREVAAATGWSLDRVDSALSPLQLAGRSPPARDPHSSLRILPYPGGRHPRIGFRDGAIAPQRETKVSVFTPWDESSYVVVDLPEAVFSNLGLLYLAHTHVPTLWSRMGMTLPRQEWTRRSDGSLTSERTLPNDVAFGASVIPTPSEIRMELWLRNGTAETLTDLRVQNCVHLGEAHGFESQTLTNKTFRPPFAAVKAQSSPRWIVTAWTPIGRCWGNEWVPCLHADPQFPDCAPGQTVRVRGWLSFFEGTDLEGELERLRANDWLHPIPPNKE